MMKPGGAPKKNNNEGKDREDSVDPRLYVMEDTSRCLTACENIMSICEEYAGGTYRIITAIDLWRSPDLARRRGNITAIPAPVQVPRTTGRRKIVSILTDIKKVPEASGLPEKPDYSHNRGRHMTRTT
jgi:hypothetical protein